MHLTSLTYQAGIIHGASALSCDSHAPPADVSLGMAEGKEVTAGLSADTM